jgi:hypothetical protein
MRDKPSYYAVITADVRYNTKLSASEKLFFAEITALTQINGKCYASNAYFAELYGVDRSTVSSWVRKLAQSGHIDVEYEYSGKEISKRFISIMKPEGIHAISTKKGGDLNNHVVRKSEGGGDLIQGGWLENPIDNNTLTESNTTPTESNTKGGAKKIAFEPPTVQEVFEIMRDQRQSQMFVSHYESKGWIVGKTQMKDWKASVRGWMARNNMTAEPMCTREQFANYGDSI